MKDSNSTGGSTRDDHHERGGFGAITLCIVFLLFVVFMIMFHCYLKRKQAARIDKMANGNVYELEWDQEK